MLEKVEVPLAAADAVKLSLALDDHVAELVIDGARKVTVKALEKDTLPEINADGDEPFDSIDSIDLRAVADALGEVEPIAVGVLVGKVDDPKVAVCSSETAVVDEGTSDDVVDELPETEQAPDEEVVELTEGEGSNDVDESTDALELSVEYALRLSIPVDAEVVDADELGCIDEPTVAVDVIVAVAVAVAEAVAVNEPRDDNVEYAELDAEELLVKVGVAVAQELCDWAEVRDDCALGMEEGDDAALVLKVAVDV